MGQVRTFIAVELPSPVREAMARIIADLKARARAPVRWVDSERAHLTLRFLGNLESVILPRLIEEVRQAAAEAAPHHFALDHPGAFPSPSRARVLWVGLAGDLDSLTGLQHAVGRAVRGMGFPPEERPFTPHITLGRLNYVTPAERRRVGEALLQVEVPAGVGMRVEAVAVMRSDLCSQGAMYTALARVPLESRRAATGPVP